MRHIALSEPRSAGAEHSPTVTAALYFSHPACLEHDPRALSPAHPDTPERLVAIERALAEDWPPGWERREAVPAQGGVGLPGQAGGC